MPAPDSPAMRRRLVDLLSDLAAGLDESDEGQVVEVRIEELLVSIDTYLDRQTPRSGRPLDDDDEGLARLAAWIDERKRAS